MAGKKLVGTKTPNELRILSLRGVSVVLDSELAAMYSVTTKRLNEQLRRNLKRFPNDFAFQVTIEEADSLRSQIATASESRPLKSQTATLKLGRGQHRKYRSWVFTEHGALQIANVLRSERAIAMSVYVIRAFVELRNKVAANSVILKRLAEIDHELVMHDSALRDIYEKLQPLLAPLPDPPARQIGFTPA